MSSQAETFYAIRCDFPECKEIYDGDEFTYTNDPHGNSDGARDSGWLIGDEQDFCAAHTVVIDCPAETMVDDGDGPDVYCQWCEDNATDTHLAPMPDTLTARIRIQIDRVINRDMWRFDQAIRKLKEAMGNERKSVEYDRRRETQKQHRAFIDADPELASLVPIVQRHHERLRELQQEASERFGRTY